VASAFAILPLPPSRFRPLAPHCPLSWHLTAKTPPLAGTLVLPPLWLSPYCCSPAGPLLLLSGCHPTAHHHWLASPLPCGSAHPPCRRGVRSHLLPHSVLSRCPPLPIPQIGDIIDCPHPTLQRGSVDIKRGPNNPARYILGQGPEVDQTLLLCYTHRDTLGGVMPPTCFSPDHPPAKAGGAQASRLPP